MNELKLNETPVRTARNFNINNINIKDISLRKKVREFEGTRIIGIDLNANLENIIEDYNLKYGLSNELINEVKNNANKTLKLTITGKKIHDIEIENNFDKENVNLIDNIEINMEEGTKANIVLKYVSKEDIENYHNGTIRVNAKKGSKLNITAINLLNTKSYNFISIQNILEENSEVEYITVDFGGKNSITNYYSKLNGVKAKNTVNTIYLGKENQLFDMNYIGELIGEKSEIEIEVQGALKDYAHKHFKGTIDFKKGSKKAKGNENEFCLFLSDTAKGISLPMLLCSEEEVEGNHSSATGKINNKELFYIMSRGFDEKDAKKLMVRAKFNNIIKKIKDEILKEEIIKEIDKRLD